MSSRTNDLPGSFGDRPDEGRVVEQFTAEPIGRTQVHRGPSYGVGTSDNDLPVRNRVQWGPIVAGAIIALGTLLLLSVLGLAIGASAFEPGSDVSDWGTGAGIYGAISAIIAFFLAGWIAAKTAAVDGKFAGLMNGLLAGALTLLILLYLTTTGVTNFLGFLGNNVSDIASVASDVVAEEPVAGTVDTPTGEEVQAEADQAVNQARQAVNDNYDRVQNGAWGTLIALVLALGAAALGGLTGFNSRRDLVAGTGRQDGGHASV